MSKRPWELLPLPPPEFDPSIGNPTYFYDNFVKPMIPDFISLMDTGLHIDQDAVEELRTTVVNVLDTVDKTLSSNRLIKEFRESQYKTKYAEYLGEMETKKKTIEHFVKEYKESNIVHRTYLVNEILEVSDLPQYKLDKWTINDIKKLLQIEDIPALQRVVNKNLSVDVKITAAAMYSMAEDKARIYNKSHYSDKISNKTFDDIVPKFNPGSAKQKAELLTDFLGFDPLTTTDGGAPQWNRPNIEVLMKSVTDTEILEILQMLVDHSFSAIIQSNFMEAFDRFNIDGNVYANFKLYGTLSYRPTSNSPNLLQLPSTGSIYAKPLKKCITAPEGYLLFTIDYSSLEDVILANITGDENKCAVFLEGMDSHCFNSLGYFPNEISEHMTLTDDMKHNAKEMKRLIDEGNKDLKAIRQKGKPITFKLAYLGFPDIEKGGTITQEIYDNYHNVLYPQISEYRDKVFNQSKQNGYVHTGLGHRILFDDFDLVHRGIWNSFSQFWSILTLISLNEINYRADRDDIDLYVNAPIYDALYGYIPDNAESVKWLNDNLPHIMEKDFMTDQIVPNSANLEISSQSWADMVELEHNLTIDQIQGVLNEDIHQI